MKSNLQEKNIKKGFSKSALMRIENNYLLVVLIVTVKQVIYGQVSVLVANEIGLDALLFRKSETHELINERSG